MNFVQPGGERIAAVLVHGGFYPNSDLDYAFFNINVNDDLTEDQCGSFASAEGTETGAAEPIKLTVNGVAFSEAQDTDGQTDAKFYHVFQRDACYEFALGFTRRDDASASTREVDPEQVFTKLETILDTVRTDPGTPPDHQVASATQPTATPAKPTGDKQ
jgi:hypothetical protein